MPRRVIGGLILSMALAAGASSGGASVAAGGATPSPQALGALQESLASEPQIRLTGSFGSREIERPVLDSAGVGSANWLSRGRRALFLSADAPPVAVPRRIPWREISEVQVGHTMTGRGALIGTLCSAFICTTMLLWALDRPPSSELPALGLVIAPIVVGPIVGAEIGRSHGHWRTVYPPPNPSSDP